MLFQKKIKKYVTPRNGEMRAFAINLEKYKEKKEHIINECSRHSINVEIIKAVDGKKLPDDYIKSVVFDYPNCLLTKGEIGCVLSHRAIYQKIIDENIDIALVLEDDAILHDGINSILQEIRKMDNDKKQCIYLLTKVESYVENKKLNSEKNDFFKVASACGTHGYVINSKAAKKLLSLNDPIIFEADMWMDFCIWYGLKIYCVLPHVIGTNDSDKVCSSLEEERKLIDKDRMLYRSKVRKTVKNYQIKRILTHFFIKSSWTVKKII